MTSREAERVAVATARGRTAFAAPDHPRLADEAHALGARWHEQTGTWSVDAALEPQVREMLRCLFTVDEGPIPVVDVRVRLDRLEDAKEIAFAARTLAWRFFRDARAELAAGVRLISGGFPASGGSVRYPAVNPASGTVVEVHGVPVYALTGERPGTYEVLAAANRSTLEIERDRLRRRLAVVEEALAAGTVLDGNAELVKPPKFCRPGGSMAPAVRERLLAELEHCGDLPAATEALGLSVLSINRARLALPEFNAAVVDTLTAAQRRAAQAAASDGGTSQG